MKEIGSGGFVDVKLMCSSFTCTSLNLKLKVSIVLPSYWSSCGMVELWSVRRILG